MADSAGRVGLRMLRRAAHRRVTVCPQHQLVNAKPAIHQPSAGTAADAERASMPCPSMPGSA